MGIRQSAARAALDRVILSGPWALQVRRIRSEDLFAVGWAELEGSPSARQARKEAEKRAKIERLRTQEQRDKQAELAANQEDLELSNAMDRVLSTAESAAAHVRRTTSYLLAGVVAMGELREPVTELRIVDLDEAKGLVDEEGMTPCTLVEDHGRMDLAATPARVWLGIFGETDRLTLGTTIMGLNNVAGEVRPFRVGSGAPPPAPPDREGVPGVPE